MKQKNLHVKHFGADNYTRINGPFAYEAYDKDRFVRRLTIGPDNPYFNPLSQMSPYLPQAVLQAEDPGFMQHRGFYLDAFRESIAKNFKERRFARGGSTISMQLVKNVFLSRDKTVSRKAEEALIVYLIENLGLVSKERMLEVYLNVIEWGPNVYGIGEASRFYFNKKPSELTLQESLFLSSIIPRPKSFQYQFDKEGQLRASMGDYFKILTTRMVWRGVLNPSDTIGLQPKVTLKGSALHVVMPKDSVTDESDGTD
jgi:membrane peptidoglycan carboxypeptidase